MKEDNFAMNGCWDVLASSTGLLVMVGSWMESAAGTLLFHLILIGVHTGGGVSVKLVLVALVSSMVVSVSIISVSVAMWDAGLETWVVDRDLFCRE